MNSISMTLKAVLYIDIRVSNTNGGTTEGSSLDGWKLPTKYFNFRGWIFPYQSMA
jgi:hypothetical protein